MSFNYEEVGKTIAEVKYKNNENSRSDFSGGNAPDKVKDKNVYMSGEEEAKNTYSTLETKANEYFQLVKDPDQERICLYIVGASGSGKSYWTNQFVKQYKLTNKTKNFFLISPIIDDTNLNS
jgi:hypothetical protein